MKVRLDGELIGKTGAKTYLAFEVQPGPHTIKASAKNDDELALTAEAGKIYFVWQEVVSSAFYPRTDLHLVDSVNGKASVKKCRLIKQTSR